jgi:hypothetical protein
MATSDTTGTAAQRGPLARRIAPRWSRVKVASARRRLLRKLPRGAVCAEIGVWRGDGAAAVLRHARPATLYLIDPWEQQAERDRSLYGRPQAEMDAVHDGVAKRFHEQIASGQVQMLRSRSQDVEVPQALDWAWIDGDHTYDAVRADLLKFAQIVKPGGYIAGDDYALGWWGDGVIRAVDEFVADVGGKLERVGEQHFLIRLAGR